MCQLRACAGLAQCCHAACTCACSAAQACTLLLTLLGPAGSGVNGMGVQHPEAIQRLQGIIPVMHCMLTCG